MLTFYVYDNVILCMIFLFMIFVSEPQGNRNW